MTEKNFRFFSLRIFVQTIVLSLSLISSGYAQNSAEGGISGRVQEIKFDQKLQKHSLKIAVSDQIANFEVDASTQIRRVVRVDKIIKGDRVISDQDGSLLPVDLKSNLNPAERPQDKRPPEKPDQSKPQSMAPPPPSTETPHGPPPAEGEGPATPPPSGEQDPEQEKASEPKKKPWEIEMENAVEPEDSLNLAENPLSQAEEKSTSEKTTSKKKTLLHQVEKVNTVEDEIQLDAISENGENETFKLPKEQLVYQIISIEDLRENSIVEIETSASGDKTKLAFITVLQ